jgi:NAD(P)-dependent dehydrogenase (short-subunit alcohol dehydrogenase family)
MEIEGTTAVVTGAGSGIGRALAEAFAAAGARVAIADVEAGALAETAAALEAAGATVHASEVDVADAAGVAAFASEVDAALGGSDILCNNAGVFAGGTVWERPVADFEWVMGVNFYGILHGVRAFVPGMIDRGRPGHVVNTISAAGLFPSAFSAPYTCAKFAGLALTECLASELAAAGAAIGVTALCPGAVKTGIATSERNRPAPSRTASSPSSEFVGQMLEENTGGGMPPSDVAPMVLDAIRTGRYLQLTSDGYATRLRVRTDELLEGVLPTLPHFD